MKMELGQIVATFYQKHGRALPWRERSDPYFVHISETMLQQTRVETVIPYFQRFLSAFPTVFELASAEEETVLKLWEGLGYYSRARNLHKAAKEVVADYGGEYPKDKEGLLCLPGVGEYTASAIMAFSYDKKHIPVDGNFLRLFARLTGYSENVLDAKAKKDCEGYFLSQINDARPSYFAQGAMEIGEVICLPSSNPLCEKCPLKDACFAYKNAKQGELPVREVKTKKKEEKLTAIVYKLGDKYGYQKREDSGLLASLYGFPMEKGHLGLTKVKILLKEKGIEASKISSLCEYTHVFSHVKWDVKACLVEIKEEKKELNLRFLSKQERVDEFPLPSAFTPIEKHLK